jgi:hypothetical protein
MAAYVFRFLRQPSRPNTPGPPDHRTVSMGHADLFVRNFLKFNFFVTTGLANGSVSV